MRILQLKMHFRGINVDKATIDIMKVKGFTYLGCIEGEEVFCNLESEESVNSCLEYLKSITGEEWSTFREKHGNRNLVFYKTSMFVFNSNYLHFTGGSSVELPLNCSSCYKMFEDCEFPEGCSLEEGKTSNVTDMYWMFYGCKFPKVFSLGENFDTSSVTNMDGMFVGCILSEGFSLGNSFNTLNVINMGCMFAGCNFPEDFSLNDNFDVSNVKNTFWMFDDCKLPEGKTREDFNSELEVVEWLKNRNSSNSCTSILSAF